LKTQIGAVLNIFSKSWTEMEADLRDAQVRDLFHEARHKRVEVLSDRPLKQSYIHA